jgi:hypothetical protein
MGNNRYDRYIDGDEMSFLVSVKLPRGESTKEFQMEFRTAKLKGGNIFKEWNEVVPQRQFCNVIVHERRIT